ncbi:MAG: D-cysteine desulfhydrase family protein, partial [Promethearchaeota archaeon]
CLLPTPIVPMKRLSEHLGTAKIYLKRDDLTGIAFGGNKNRKLEFLLADALETNADTIITEGALQSNHCLQTAACSAKLGLDCELVLSGSNPDTITGNLLLQHILDVKIHRAQDSTERKDVMKKVKQELISSGKNPYLIPTGGSTKIGALGYVNCIREISESSKKPGIKYDYFIHATGSAGTQAGVVIGKQLYYPELEILGFNVGAPKGEIETLVEEIVKDFEEEHSLDLSITRSSIKIYDEYFGEGYAIASKEMIRTVKLVAKLEGIFLDPVYNGKAMVGLIDLIKKGIIPDDANVLFLHSGGGPSLFAYQEAFVKDLEPL